jgi:predicted DNA binding CopG/RHH family protein
MAEAKQAKIEIRMSIQEKDAIKEYAAAHNLTVSELVRIALNKTIGGAA